MIEEKDIALYVKWILEQSSTPIDEIEFLVKNLNPEAKASIKEVIKELTEDDK